MRQDSLKLLKTHGEKMSAFCLAIMLMKRKELHHSLQDVDEKKGHWLKPKVENGEGGVRQGPLWFCPPAASTVR
jgi:hypothetical protein